MIRRLSCLIFMLQCVPLRSFTIGNGRLGTDSQKIEAIRPNIDENGSSSCTVKSTFSRRDIFGGTVFSVVVASSAPAWAASRESLEDLLYRIVRVREATIMESRLIRTGKFKDAQRANIKLAVRFMVDNYRLNDAFVAASTYLDGTNRRLEATQIGQSATQNLVTILEYFDASDVQNLKVSFSKFLNCPNL
jgi:hypothetical protein